jgi:hypothetical protein
VPDPTPRPIPRKRTRLVLPIVVLVIAVAFLAAVVALPRVAGNAAGRALDRLAGRLPGTVERSAVDVRGFSRVLLDRLEWRDGTDLRVEIRDVEVEVDVVAWALGGSPARGVRIGTLAVRLGDPARPYARPGDAVARLRDLASRLGERQARPGTDAGSGRVQVLPDVAVARITGSLLLADAPVEVTGGSASLHAPADTWDVASRELSATLDVRHGPSGDRRVEVGLTLGAGARPEAASVHVTPAIAAEVAGGAASARGVEVSAGEARLVGPAWTREGRVSVSALAIAVRWETDPGRAPSPPDPAFERLLPESTPSVVRDLLAGARLREVEVDRPVLDVVLAPDAPVPVPPGRTEVEDARPARPEGVFRHAVMRTFEGVRGRLAGWSDALAAASKDVPAGTLSVHGATVRYLLPGSETAAPERSLANLDAVLSRDRATGRIEGRVRFECPEAASSRNEARFTYDPADGATTATLQAAYLPLYPYRAALPSWLVAGRASLLSKTDVRVAIGPRGSTLDATGRVEAAGVTVVAPSVASVPLPDLDLGLSGSVAVDVERGEVRAVDGAFSIAAARMPFELTATGLRSAPRIRLRGSVERIKAADLVASIPPAAIPALQGLRLAGSFAAAVDVDVDTANLSTVRLDFRPDVADLQVLDLGRGVNLDLLRTQFLHRIEEGGGKVVGRVVGPSSPDWLPTEDVPRRFVDALTTGEDSQFFSHHGFSVAGIRRSLSVNLERGGFYQGASTLSQQLVKNLFLSHEKTLARKLQEALITWQLERFLSKEKILELYLNVIEWGPEVFGLSQAAMHYFGKLPKELTLLESAFLVAIIPNPRAHHVQFERGAPTPAFDARVKGLVREMRRRGLVTADEADEAIEQRLRFVPFQPGAPPPEDDGEEPSDDE